jgi:Ca-activated chloride channel family protein
MTRKPNDTNANDSMIHEDDPRITAYALGELSKEEAADLESKLSANPKLQETIASVQETAGILKQALSEEPAVGLTKQGRAAIEMRINTHEIDIASGKRTSRFAKVIWITSGLAACVLLALSIWPLSHSRAREHSTKATQPNAANRRNISVANDAIRFYSTGDGRSSQRGRAVTFPAANSSSPRQDVRLDRLASLGYSADDRNEFTVPVPGLSSGIYVSPDGARFTGFHSRSFDDLLVGRQGWSASADSDGVRDTFPFQESTAERYAHIRENPFKSVSREPLSTFSIDVDTASYANARRFLNSGQLPPRDAVRIEEFINYFAYDYPQPTIDEPFSINVDVADCPWNRNHRLARIGLQGYEIPNDERPYSNLVFLIDVSGSMNSPAKLPLLKQSMKLLVDQLDEYDRVAIVVYAGASGLVLDSITCDNRGAILDAIDNLRSGGSTNGAAGIELAYQIATENFITDGTNRVILATDGDFNVGITSEDDLHRLIEEKAKTGVFLSVLGFGGGNYQDATLELLADKGNGNYAYIDTLREAEKVLVEQMGGTLVTIAKDVKIQVEFNPAIAAAYRLIGYENRMLAKEDFNDDTKDAGEIGAGHTVTALYEIVPAGESPELPDIDPLKYQLTDPSPELIDNDELMTVKVRYKLPDEDKSTKLVHAVLDEGATIEEASDDFRFAAAVASFGMILRNSSHRGDAAFDQVFELAENTSNEARSEDRDGFVELVEKAQAMVQLAEAAVDDDE